MATVGFLTGDNPNDAQYVGAKDDGYEYYGPVARVTFDATWLHISTDDYEGHALLNIEALPYLQEALAKIAAQLKTAGNSA